MGPYSSDCVKKFLDLAVKCSLDEQKDRPFMLEVVRELENTTCMLPAIDNNNIALDLDVSTSPTSANSRHTTTYTTMEGIELVSDAHAKGQEHKSLGKIQALCKRTRQVSSLRIGPCTQSATQCQGRYYYVHNQSGCADKTKHIRCATGVCQQVKAKSMTPNKRHYQRQKFAIGTELSHESWDRHNAGFNMTSKALQEFLSQQLIHFHSFQHQMTCISLMQPVYACNIPPKKPDFGDANVTIILSQYRTLFPPVMSLAVH
uniref:Uncharacterized protein n=1 Tax=Solanum lycopersicum TaxID=4081 RepID=A0A3Q7JCD8_SOLLC